MYCSKRRFEHRSPPRSPAYHPSATGDSHIDDHHTVEDVGIALGKALGEALGDKRGIRRYGACLLPMDDTLVRAALDLSGRPHLVWEVEFTAPKIGTFDTELVREFFNALAMNGGNRQAP